MSVSFSGTAQVNIFRAITLKSGLRLYAKTGMKPNRVWTPTNMLRAAGELTGTNYKRGEYVKAANDLESWIEENKGCMRGE